MTKYYRCFRAVAFTTPRSPGNALCARAGHYVLVDNAEHLEIVPPDGAEEVTEVDFIAADYMPTLKFWA